MLLISALDIDTLLILSFGYRCHIDIVVWIAILLSKHIYIFQVQIHYLFYITILSHTTWHFYLHPPLGGGPILIHRSHYSQFLLPHPIGGTSKWNLLAGTRIIGSVDNVDSGNLITEKDLTVPYTTIPPILLL